MMKQKTLIMIVLAVAALAVIGKLWMDRKVEPAAAEGFKAVKKTYPSVGNPRVTAIRNPGYLDQADYTKIYQ